MGMGAQGEVDLAPWLAKVQMEDLDLCNPSVYVELETDFAAVVACQTG